MTQHTQQKTLYSFGPVELWGACSAEGVSMEGEDTLGNTGVEVPEVNWKAFNRLVAVGVVLLTTATVSLMGVGMSSPGVVVAEQPQTLIQR